MSEIHILDTIVKRWEPLIRGVESPTDAQLICWVMEQETRYQKAKFVGAGDDPAAKARIGMAFKFIFPIIRRAVPKINVLDRLASLGGADTAQVALQGAVWPIVVDELSPMLVAEGASGEPSALGFTDGVKFTRDLAGRIASAVLSCPEGP